MKSASKIVRQATILIEEKELKNTNSSKKLITKSKAQKNRSRIEVSRLKVAKKEIYRLT